MLKQQIKTANTDILRSPQGCVKIPTLKGELEHTGPIKPLDTYLNYC